MSAARLKSKKSKIKSAEDLESFRDISDDVIESDFVPFACLYDPDTLATKNGELLQIIKITGLGFDTGSGQDLRAAIRQAIRQCIPDTSYAIWLHTLRRQQAIMPAGKFPDAFSQRVDALWRETHPASASFVNELYVTVVKAGQQAGLRNMEALLQSLRPGRDKTVRSAYLDTALNQLASTTASMLNVLRPFGARLLTVTERDGIYYSEQLEFLEKLINLEERPMPVPERDLSQVLTSGEITFGFNAMEVRTAENHRRFATILTVKEYKESTLAGIDKFLDIPCELIISQCFDFVGGEQARDAYATQARYLTISGDKELGQWLEIDRLTAESEASKAFGQQQTSIFLIAPSVRQLEANVKLAGKALARLGMVAVREDLRFEDCYWAQLPGNFPFISRQHSVDTEHLAGFANLQNRPMGNAAGSAWGPPVSLFSTLQDTPYFFNFQRDNTAHTILLGKPGSGRTTLTHFLLAQARKLPNVRIWYLDAHGRAGPLITAMGGIYAAPGTPQLQINPFQLEATPANREFLALWLSTLLDPSGGQLNKSSLAFFQSLVGQLMALPQHERRLSSLIPIAREADAMLAKTLSRFAEGGEFGELFDMPADHLRTAPLIGWNIARFCKQQESAAPLASYLLHRLTMMLDGTPTLLVLDEGFQLLNNPLFGPRAAAWCDYLATKNTAVLLTSDSAEGSGSLPFTAALAQRAASIFALPDPHAPQELAMGFRFTAQEISAIAHADRAQHHVLMKRGDIATMLKLDLGNLGDALPTLHGREAPAETEKSPADLLADLMGYSQAAGAMA